MSTVTNITTPNEEPRKPIKRHRLTADEKATVLKLYEEMGVGCWDKVQEVLHLKSKRTAREHFYKFILTDSKKPFTQEEDDLIIEKVNELGTRWSQIAKFFDNRSDINIRNRYRIISRKKDSKGSKKKTRKSEQSSPSLYQSPPCSPVTVMPLQPMLPAPQPGEKYIILDYHHFDIISMQDMNVENPDDYFAPNCYRM